MTEKNNIILASEESEIVTCSNCFKDHGIKLFAIKLGVENHKHCPNCSTDNGYKLKLKDLEYLAYQFFVRGSTIKQMYGEAPFIEYNEYHYQKTDISLSEKLNHDIKLIEEITKKGFFLYGPPLWRIGYNELLIAL